MAILKYIERMHHIDGLLRSKSACTVHILSKRIRLSRSTTLEYLNDMKTLGFPIKYSRKDKCYTYNIKGRMTTHLFIEDVEK